MIREALTGVVAFGWPDAQVTHAVDFPSAWTRSATQPDLILCDLVMPGSAPVDGVTKLRKLAPNAAIMVVTGNEDDAVFLELLEAGIAGFVPKTSKSEVIEAAIRLVLAGGRYIPPRIIELAARRHSTTDSAGSAYVRLTERQGDVLRLIASGQTNKEVARGLDLSPATVKAHAAAAIATLGASNRTEAVVKARALGLI